MRKMRRPICFLLCLAALLACCTVADAQKRRPTPPARPSITVPRTPQPKWQISTQTDSEDGEVVTLLSLQPFPLGVAAGARYTMLFGVNYSYTENDPAHVKNISLDFFARAPTCHFPTQSSLDLSLDNASVTLPYQPKVKGADEVAWVSNDTEVSGVCNDSLGALISRTTLTRLAAVRSLSGKIGDLTFQFTADDFAALRDLVSHLNPQRPPVRK